MEFITVIPSGCEGCAAVIILSMLSVSSSVSSNTAWKHLVPSSVISHGVGKEQQSGKKTRQCYTKASLFERSNCLFKYCHGESQKRMAHLFFPFKLCSWILSGRPRPQQLDSEGGGHGNTSPGGLLSFLNLPQCSAVFRCYPHQQYSSVRKSMRVLDGSESK